MSSEALHQQLDVSAWTACAVPHCQLWHEAAEHRHTRRCLLGTCTADLAQRPGQRPECTCPAAAKQILRGTVQDRSAIPSVTRRCSGDQQHVHALNRGVEKGGQGEAP